MELIHNKHFYKHYNTTSRTEYFIMKKKYIVFISSLFCYVFSYPRFKLDFKAYENLTASYRLFIQFENEFSFRLCITEMRTHEAHV